MRKSSWPEVQSLIEEAPYPVTVLPTDAARGADQLARLGLGTWSWLAAVVQNSGGLLVDHGWLRVLGAGTAELPGVADVAEPGGGRLTVAYDVLGGRFDWMENDEGAPTIRYFGPEDLIWDDLGAGYGDWLESVLRGGLTTFYSAVRWPGWEQEVAAVPLDKGIHTWPPPWSTEGADLSAVSRRAISFAELVSFHEEMARQLDGQR
ncbi:DUF2625 family protein [Pseudonocardia sp. CA-107938]|uniref:DUF2625 family protein n=1 Tax=Pseudonocardia sp. CA-107938 TaxID=3240021 RepID=UPI003D90B2FD